MRYDEYLVKKQKEIAGLLKFGGEKEKNKTFLVNNRQNVMRHKIEEYNVWYEGDGDELLQFYTREMMIESNREPIYDRNKRGYFWSISSTEGDIKRSHSGQPRNIIDTLVNIIGEPESIECSVEGTLRDILDENEFWELYTDVQLPMTLVEGWGCYKIDWNIEKSDKPIIKYYHAGDVDFIYSDDNRISGIIFKDYYIDKGNKKWLIAETRQIIKGELYVSKDIFKYDGEESVMFVKSVPDDLRHIDTDTIKISCKALLAVPCMFYKDREGYGRSIFTGKCDLFDDLDQCLSQSANTVRRSTVIEYFNTDFLERDRKTGIPRMPKSYDRKYTGYVGGRNSDGASNGVAPVQVTQPQIMFHEFTNEATAILVQIINGIMSPATLGIDVAKKDNADAQREKEKITIFTRNSVIKRETRILKSLFNQVLMAYEIMLHNGITATDYNVSIKYSEFADDSYENKLTTLGKAYIEGMLSTDMYLDKLYGDTITEEEREAEKKYLEENKNPFDESKIGNFGEDL